jgi:hypothetical protein
MKPTAELGRPFQRAREDRVEHIISLEEYESQGEE